jgi:hypothetical protein
MRLQVMVLGRQVLEVRLGGGDQDDQGPGDVTTDAHQPIGFRGRWEDPSIPALEVER